MKRAPDPSYLETLNTVCGRSDSLPMVLERGSISNGEAERVVDHMFEMVDHVGEGAVQHVGYYMDYEKREIFNEAVQSLGKELLFGKPAALCLPAGSTAPDAE